MAPVKQHLRVSCDFYPVLQKISVHQGCMQKKRWKENSTLEVRIKETKTFRPLYAQVIFEIGVVPSKNISVLRNMNISRYWIPGHILSMVSCYHSLFHFQWSPCTCYCSMELHSLEVHRVMKTFLSRFQLSVRLLCLFLKGV